MSETGTAENIQRVLLDRQICQRQLLKRFGRMHLVARTVILTGEQSSGLDRFGDRNTAGNVLFLQFLENLPGDLGGFADQSFQPADIK